MLKKEWKILSELPNNRLVRNSTLDVSWAASSPTYNHTSNSGAFDARSLDHGSKHSCPSYYDPFATGHEDFPVSREQCSH